MIELAFMGARELARRIRRKELSSLEVVDYFLRRIEHKNPALNAVVTLAGEEARTLAAQADRALASQARLGPLHGVPMTVKDAFSVKALRTTAGTKAWRDHVPSEDALAVERLRTAGAIIMGKTNTPAFCADVQTYNPIFGTTHNPWDLTRTPGGSSGGSAAALASGMTPIELGSDIAGSIRIPAHFCGVFGHKPSFGLIPLQGHLPGPPGQLAAIDLGVAGPMARSADDLALLLQVLAGPPPEEAKGYRLQLLAARSATLRGYRVAAWLDDPAFSVDASVATCLQSAVQRLTQSGAQIESSRPALELRAVYDLYRALLDPVMSLGLPPKVVAELDTLATGSSDPRNVFARNALIRHREWLALHELRTHLRAVWARFFDDYDVLLCPVAMLPAISHDHSEPQAARTLPVNGHARSYQDLFAWNSLATSAYLPATVAPVGRTPEGLPVGIQIIGPYLEDNTTIDFAGRVSEVLGGFTPPAGY
jgi:amidase